MKNVAKISTIILVSALIAMLCWIPNAAVAQVSVFGNNPTGGAYLGWNGAQDLDFKTNNILRMQLMETGNTTINGSIINTSGFLGLHTTSPWSMFHIQGPNNTPWGGNGFRKWMHTGTYLMENSDNLYVGMKDEDFNRSDAIWAWGDD